MLVDMGTTFLCIQQRCEQVVILPRAETKQLTDDGKPLNVAHAADVLIIRELGLALEG